MPIKPDYCPRRSQKIGCDICSLRNYNRDCMNNLIPEYNKTPFELYDEEEEAFFDEDLDDLDDSDTFEDDKDDED